jgi:sortase A
MERVPRRTLRAPSINLRRITRAVGLVLVVAGVGLGAWVVVVWQWKDPFTSIYTWYEQRQLRGKYDERVRAYHATAVPPGATPVAIRMMLRREARSYRLASRRGQPIGRLEVQRLGLNMIVLNGTDSSSLEKGPGRDLRTFMPGEGELMYVAGHRTTYLAPFAHIDDLRRGDPINLAMPYGDFRYAVTGHIIVPADDLARLRSHGYEELALQACHPRFFATHRYIVYARPVGVTLPSGPTYRLWRGSA